MLVPISLEKGTRLRWKILNLDRSQDKQVVKSRLNFLRAEIQKVYFCVELHHFFRIYSHCILCYQSILVFFVTSLHFLQRHYCRHGPSSWLRSNDFIAWKQSRSSTTQDPTHVGKTTEERSQTVCSVKRSQLWRLSNSRAVQIYQSFNHESLLQVFGLGQQVLQSCSRNSFCQIQLASVHGVSKSNWVCSESLTYCLN